MKRTVSPTWMVRLSGLKKLLLTVTSWTAASALACRNKKAKATAGRIRVREIRRFMAELLFG
jgi:hypothetical protein